VGGVLDRTERLAAVGVVDELGRAHRYLDAVDLVEETRARLPLNVSAELAFEALAYRLDALLERT